MDAVLKSAAESPLFAGTAAPYLLLDTGLTIRAANPAYLRATRQTESAIVGLPMFEAFPDNPLDPAADGVRNLSASLTTVLETGRTHEMQLQRYDVRPVDRSASGSDEFEEKHWVPVNSPILDEGGRVAAILHHVEDVTAVSEFVRNATGEAATLRSLARALAKANGPASAALSRRSSRLGDALQALAVTRMLDTAEVAMGRRGQIWDAVAAQADEPDWSGWTQAVCVAAVENLDTVDGAAVTVVGDRGTDLHLLGATGSWARELSAVDVLVPGPAELALHGAVPVVAERLDDHADLWPAYVEAVADIGLAAVAAYPLAIGGRPFGVLTLYRGDPEARATHGEEMEAAMFAELAVTAVLADSGRTGDPPNLGEGGGTSILVGAAARSLSIRQTIGFDTALSRLRMHALLNGQSTLSVAQQVLRRELPRID